MSVIQEGVFSLIRNGLIEIIVFALVFAIVFGILRNIKLFAPKGNDDYKTGLQKVKGIHTIIALVLAALTILPHYVSTFSSYDIIPIIERAFPQISLVAIALIGVMVVLGMFGLKLGGGRDGNIFKPVIFIVLLGIVIWIFGGTINIWRVPNWITPDLTAIIIALIVFGIVVSFIMGPGKEKPRDEKIWEQFKDIIEEKK